MPEGDLSTDGVATTFEDTGFGRILVNKGREMGREEASIELFTELLSVRFGSHPTIPDTARRLATWPHGAAQAVMNATSLDDITTAQPTT